MLTANLDRWLAYAILTITLVAGLWLALDRHDAAQQKIGYARAAAECQQAYVIAAGAALAKERSMQKNLQEAQNAATERETKLRADYAAAHAAARGLRDTIADLRGRLAAAPLAACRATAGACLDVFEECTDQYRAVAEAADGHRADLETLTQAWPR